jgi:hypothetical protein
MTLIVDIYHSHKDRDERKIAQSYAFADEVTSDEIARWIYNAELERVRRLDGDAFPHILQVVNVARGSDGRGNGVEASIAYWLTIAIHTA